MKTLEPAVLFLVILWSLAGACTPEPTAVSTIAQERSSPETASPAPSDGGKGDLSQPEIVSKVNVQVDLPAQAGPDASPVSAVDGAGEVFTQPQPEPEPQPTPNPKAATRTTYYRQYSTCSGGNCGVRYGRFRLFGRR